MKEKNKENPFSSPLGTPSEEDVFQDRLKDSPSSEDLFTVPFDPTQVRSPRDGDSALGYAPQTADGDPRRISNTQALLVAGIAAVFFVLVYSVFFMDSEVKDTAPTSDANAPVAKAVKASDSVPEAPVAVDTVAAQVPAPDEARPLSRKLAETLYSEMAFDQAFDVYSRLRQRLAQTQQNPALQDFLTLRMALCQKGMGDTDRARQLFRSVCSTHTGAVASMARYHEALLLLYDDQYLDSATKAYQALALVDAVDNAPQWVKLFKQYCDYLINQAITTCALSLYDAERDLPDEAFALPPVPDPFLHLNEREFQTLLSSGQAALEQALLGPRIIEVGPDHTAPHWRVVSNGAPLEETLTRFVSHSGSEIDWSYDLDMSADMIDKSIRQRPVHVLISNASDQRVTTILAGCVGLFAHINQGNTIRIRDPRRYKSSSEHARVWALRAIDLCQQLLLRYEDQKHAPHAYLALGLLQRHTGQTNEALAAFKQVYNRFPRHALAPYALLYASRLKTDTGDLLGAKADLELLVAQYPDVEFSGNAHIYLADATRCAGYWHDAIGLYRKVYNLNMSRHSRTQAAYGAGLCCFAVKDYEGILRWFDRFEASSQDEQDDEQDQAQIRQALLLRGQAYAALGRYAQASDLFQQALEHGLSKAEYVDALAGYAEANRQQQKYLAALNRISAEHPWSFSSQDRNRITLIKARIFQAMGLNDKAVSLLADQLSFLSDPNQLAEAHLQLAQCYTLSGKLTEAKSACIQGLLTAKTPPLINQIRFQLAQTSLQLGQTQEVIHHCQDLLATKPKQSFKNQIYGLMAQAYKRADNYEKALKVLLSQVPEKTDAETGPGEQMSTAATLTMN